ncbi:MAG: pyrimidine 5'-nucleotidase [Burkholderiales bacterium]|nr:pyrimidine 5'-nucleotidase [Burkholderiales bacterium]
MVTPSRRCSRSRPLHPARGSAGPVWLFDLDNTLHHASHAIFPRINAGMTAYIVERLGIELDLANHLRVEYTRRYGATLLGLIRHHGVDAHDFLAAVHDFPDLRALLRAERGLARHLRALPGRKYVLTNGPRDYAEAVLREIGITHLFERCISIEHMRDRSAWRAKPDPKMMRRLLARERLRAARVWLVEDTRSHLKDYRAQGLRTVWVTGYLPEKSGLGATNRRSGRPHYVDIKVQSLKTLKKCPIRVAR